MILTKKYSNNEVDAIVSAKNIKRLEPFDGVKVKHKWQCLICQNEWASTLDSIKNVNTGCPSCHDVAWSDEEIDRALVGRNIKRMDDYAKGTQHRKWQCLICNKEWFAIVSKVLNKKTGCPECFKQSKTLNDDLIDAKLKEQDRGIIRAELYPGKNYIKMAWTNQECGHTWQASAHNILDNWGNCDICNEKNVNEKLVYSLLLHSSINFEYQKRLQHINNKYPNYILDFYIPNSNMIIEYNGDQHYKPVKFSSLTTDAQSFARFQNQIKRDQALEIICQKDNIKLIWIDGRKLRAIN